MTQVTKESLSSRINSLEAKQRVFGLTLQEEYNLKAYKMLFGYVSDCNHTWVLNRNAIPTNWECEKCKMDMRGEL